MSQTQKVSKNNTTIASDGEDTVITLHRTEVVRFNAFRVILNNGGWVTATTVCRMNQVSNQYGLGFSVGRKQGVMTVWLRAKDITLSFDQSGEVSFVR